MRLENYVTTDLIFVNQTFKSKEELFEAIYERALSLGYIREDFLERIKEREQNFPTGLQLENLGVALPHTDAECIKKEFVAIVTTQPIQFTNMEDFNQVVNVEIAFVLGLSKPHAQLEMLQSLIGVLQDPEILLQIREADSVNNIVNIIKEKNL